MITAPAAGTAATRATRWTPASNPSASTSTLAVKPRCGAPPAGRAAGACEPPLVEARSGANVPSGRAQPRSRDSPAPGPSAPRSQDPTDCASSDRRDRTFRVRRSHDPACCGAQSGIRKRRRTTPAGRVIERRFRRYRTSHGRHSVGGASRRACVERQFCRERFGHRSAGELRQIGDQSECGRHRVPGRERRTATPSSAPNARQPTVRDPTGNNPPCRVIERRLEGAPSGAFGMVWLAVSSAARASRVLPSPTRL